MKPVPYRVAVMCTAAVMLLLSLAQPISAQEGPQRAGLIVVHGDGRVLTRCVAFDEPQITGSALLARSGLSVVSTTGPLGQTICSLNGEGCPASSCWCECAGTPCVYWVYHNQQPDGSWAYANLGAAQRVVTDGDVDAWVWGEITQSPPAIGFEAICGDTAAPSEAPPAPTSPPVAEPSATAEVTATAEATATAGASPVVPTPTLTPAPPSASATPLAATRTPSAEASPTPVSTATPPVPTASVEVVDTPETVTITPSPTPAASAPTATAPSPASSEGAATQYLAFALAFGAVALAFVLLTRCSGD